MSADPRPLRFRLLLWLYSNRNIVGSALALLGPTLYLAGIVEQYWLWITLGLYGTGALLAPSPPELSHQLADSLTSEQMLRALDELIARAQKQLTADMLAHLDSIRGSVRDVLPRLEGAISDDAFTVRQTIARYLPDALASYVALPRAFRSAHRLENGMTAQELLGDQLRLLDEQLQKVVVSVARNDADALLVHGQFLREKFAPRDPF